MVKWILSFFVICIACSSCGSNDPEQNTASEKESYKETKESLQRKEEKNPMLFLEVKNNNRKNFFGQTVIRGEITNTATLAKFKDVDLKLTFYSKTKALLETDKETIFEEFNAGETTKFKTKYFAPKGTDSVYIEVLGAKVVK